MKKKIAIICCLVLVVASLLSVFVACDKGGLSDESLKALRANLYNQYKEDAAAQNESYKVLGEISGIDADGKEIKAGIVWTIEGTDKVTVSAEKDSNGNYTINVPDTATLSEDLSYTLTATLVDAQGNAYKNSEDAAYSVSFNRKAEKYVGPRADAILSFDTTGKITARGEEFTDQWGKKGFESVTWAEKGITLVNKRGESVNGCGEYVSPARFYSKSTIEISYTSAFKAIRLTLNSSSSSAHATGFDNMTVAGANIKRSGDIVVISFATPVEKFVSAPLAAQTRISTVEVFTSTVPVLEEETKYETEAEILAALKKLELGATLTGGEYTLTGTIASIDSAYDSQYKNVTVTIEVGAEKLAIQCFRLKGGEELVVGDTITVTGTLLNYKVDDETGKLEFNSGCTYVKAGGGNENPADGAIIAPSEAVADTAYKLAVVKSDKTLYAKAEMSGYYLATSETAGEGADIYVEAAEGGYKLYFKSGSDKIYLGAQVSGTHANIGLSSNGFPATVWAYDATHKCFTTTLTLEGAEPTVFYMGSSGTYKTISLSDSTKFTPGEGTNYVAALATGAVSGNGGNGGNQGGGNQGSGDSEYGNDQLPELGTPAASIDLTENHCQGDASSKTVTLNGITVTNDKGKSTSNVAIQDSYADRFYKSSDLTIEYTSAMTAIKIVCDDYDNGNYTTGLDGLTIAGATVKRNGATIVIELTTPATSLEIVGLAAQLRVNSIEVYTA